MENNKLRLGLALTGSYCSFGKLAQVLPALCGQFQVYPIFSENAQKDSRFGPGRDWLSLLENESGHSAVTTIFDAEPLGPGNVIDVLAIVPCTGNTLGKLAHGITDTAVTMAAKGHLRNGKPLVVGVSTNDGLGASAESIGRLLNRRNIYFVPFRQDAPAEKPASLSCDYAQIAATVEAAARGRQLQPVLLA
ncbi:MAG: dipicolinate synthase subunit B [Oscillospiraceae bacterium]|nr:dipicolinate synthase subunit B [Oscillospiraceae bacterium]